MFDEQYGHPDNQHQQEGAEISHQLQQHGSGRPRRGMSTTGGIVHKQGGPSSAGSGRVTTLTNNDPSVTGTISNNFRLMPNV
ncbi:MAG: hypothetical protein ACOYZ6_08850 [Chloroflexota bacterium]